ncbi:GerAB/ArcD/ProY family transporter [Senegalia sp. (in: firmicutes)]|uniref:GerAB/ArcD/ProY family transporter n=1 Tax=Senegalia sp. (in: firmicutes) TaxID=1924098 RepID=UPI003F98187E
MTGGNDKITKGQSATLIIGSILGVGILTLPSELAKESGNSGMIMIIIGTILSIFIISIFTKLMLKFESKTVVEIMDELLPRPIAIIFESIFVLFYISSAAAVVRIFADIVKMFLLKETPLEVIIISMLLASVYIVRKGIEGIARLVQVILPIVIIPFALLLISLIPELDFQSVNNIMRFNTSDILKGLNVSLFSFIGMDIVLISMAYVEKPKKILKYNISVISFLGLIYLIIFIVVTCQFGIEQTRDLLWPTLFLMKTINIPGSFLENVEGVVIGLWTFIVIQSLCVILMQTNIILSKSFKLKEIDFLAVAIIPILYLLALVPQNINEVYYYIGLFSNYLGTSVTIIIPFILFGLAIFKKKGASKI